MDCHKKFVKKLKRKGAKLVDSPKESDVTIVFCPIVSRFETDIKAALSSISGKHAEMHMKMLLHVLSFSCIIYSLMCVCTKDLECEKVILVAMHHTFDTKYTIPNYRDLNNRAVILLVDCLFFETKGLLKCPLNRKAFKDIRKEVNLNILTIFLNSIQSVNSICKT